MAKLSSEKLIRVIGENHRKFCETLGWRKCSDDILNRKLNIRTTESGDKFLVVDGYEISINTLLKLPKED